MYEVAIIMINYNSSQFTMDCIASLKKHTDPGIEIQIIIVDNNSEMEDFRKLEDHLKGISDLELHRSIINTGFSSGNMYGAQFARANYLLFLNNDTLFNSDCISVLLKYLKAHPEVGTVTAQNYDIKERFIPSFDHDKGLRKMILGRRFLEKNNPSRYPPHEKLPRAPIEVDFINGACMMFPYPAFAACGGFDTHLFLYYEEMDICHRLRKHSFKSVVHPGASIIHFLGGSTGKSLTIRKEFYLSYLYVIRKNFGFMKYFLIKIYLLIRFLFKPYKWPLLSTILCPHLSKSLRIRQKIKRYEGAD